ncbi:MAG: hypothetical protein K9K78_06725 [Spirochaetales bacterium]|nr:hypothetical protein [Spirochaetales bacterium]
MTEGVMIVFIVIGLPVICGTLLAMNKSSRKSKGKKDDTVKDEEAQIIDEIYWGLKDLNHRIENLEAIVFKNDKGE